MTEAYAKGEVKKIDLDTMDKWKMRKIEHADEKKHDLVQRVRDEGYEIVSGSPLSMKDNGVIPRGIYNAFAYYALPGKHNSFLVLPVMPMHGGPRRFQQLGPAGPRGA